MGLEGFTAELAERWPSVCRPHANQAQKYLLSGMYTITTRESVHPRAHT